MWLTVPGKPRSRFFAAFSLVLAAALATVFADKGLGGGLYDTLVSSLTAAQQQSLVDLVRLAEIEAAVAVVESTNLGVDLGLSANVQVGAAVSALSRVLKWALAGAAAGAAIYEGALGILAVARHIAPVVLFGALSLGAAHALTLSCAPGHPVRSATRVLCEGAALAAFTVTLALPIAIYGAGHVAKGLPANLGGTSAQIATLHDALTADTKTGEGLRARIAHQETEKAFARVAHTLPDSVADVVQHAVAAATHAVIVGIVLPVAFVLLALWAVRRPLRVLAPPHGTRPSD